MGLVICESCGKEIASNARVCPHCGRRRTHPFVMGCAVFLVGILLIIIYASYIGRAHAALENHPESHSATPAQRASAGAMVLRKVMQFPESFRLYSAVIVDGTGAVCYRFLTKNSLGGISSGMAVLAPDGKFMTSEARVFREEWQKECAGKPGRDIAKSIRWLPI